MLKINLNSPVPIYEQLISEIKSMIDSGELRTGDSLPTIRSLASQLDIAINTVARAYQELENLKLIESNGRKGSIVKDKKPDIPEDETKIFKDTIRALLQQGMDRKDIEQIFNKNLSLFFD